MELEQDYERLHSEFNGTMPAYLVEARYNFKDPLKVGSQIFDNRWRRVDFIEAERRGVPQCSASRKRIIEHGLLGYASAQALRWWLHAQAEHEHGFSPCLESRIIQYRITWNSKAEAVEAFDHIHGDDRSNCNPAWRAAAEGTKEMRHDG